MNYVDIIKNNQKYFEDFVTRSTYHSNAIEGSSLSLNETYALLFDTNHCKVSDVSSREIYEAINHKKIMMILLDKLVNKEILSKDLVVLINQTINENIMYIGGYRLGPVRIVGSKKSFPLPEELDKLMDEYIERYNKIMTSDASLEDIAKLHMDYENIHPFPDGNGRTGRLLINYLLLYQNKVPLIVAFESREAYLECLEKNDVKGLASLFVSLQNEEEQRIKDFENMGK